LSQPNDRWHLTRSQVSVRPRLEYLQRLPQCFSRCVQAISGLVSLTARVVRACRYLLASFVGFKFMIAHSAHLPVVAVLNELDRSEASTMPKNKLTTGPIRTQPIERAAIIAMPILGGEAMYAVLQ
jgi:hypothetical protein